MFASGGSLINENWPLQVWNKNLDILNGVNSGGTETGINEITCLEKLESHPFAASTKATR